MLTVLPVPIMEYDSGTLLRAGKPKEEVEGKTQSCTSQTSSSAWGDYQGSNLNKRRLSNALTVTPPENDAQEENFPLNKKIKTEPKDDYALAEEECARNASELSTFGLNAEYVREEHEPWLETGNSSSPILDRIPSFAAIECHKFTDNCKQCVINDAQTPDLDNISLHRRRQIREFEQSGEEPLSNKIRVWKEKRLEKLMVRGKPTLRIDEEALLLELKKRKAHIDDEELRHHHMTTRSRNPSSTTEEENGVDNGDSNYGYLRYLLTRGSSSTSPVSPGEEKMVEEPQGISMVTGDNFQEQTAAHRPLPNEAIDDHGKTGTLGKDQMETTAGKVNKVPRKKIRNNQVLNFADRQEKSPAHQDNLLTGNNKSKKPKNKLKNFENGVQSMDKYRNIDGDEFDESSTLQSDNLIIDNGETKMTEQYISDIQRPYCNVPDDHQVTHINGVMSLPATRETRYGITLGELKRRTGFPEFLTRVDLIAYVRQSKSAGRALLDKYNIATAGQKSRPTILSKMCENEARVLGDGVNRMNAEYFPWKTLARIASNKLMEGKANDTAVEQKVKAIQNTRTMLKEMYDLMVENKDIPTMRTFEVASHTFGTANILNHLTVFDRLFEEYQSNLMFRRDVRNNSRKL